MRCAKRCNLLSSRSSSTYRPGPCPTGPNAHAIELLTLKNDAIAGLTLFSRLATVRHGRSARYTNE
jgi:hypothetical protein